MRNIRLTSLLINYHKVSNFETQEDNNIKIDNFCFATDFATISKWRHCAPKLQSLATPLLHTLAKIIETR